MAGIDNSAEHERFQIDYEPLSASVLFLNITGFTTLVRNCIEITNRRTKRHSIEKLLNHPGLVIIEISKTTGRRVLTEANAVHYDHELRTAIRLIGFNYDVLFAPVGLFSRNEKRFDVFMLRDIIILKADLKAVTSKNPDTIAKRIKSGSEQASRLVIDICSDIRPAMLIDGLRSGVERNELILELLVIYRNRFYRLSKQLILSNKIYDILK
jgi:hypothetical protein